MPFFWPIFMGFVPGHFGEPFCLRPFCVFYFCCFTGQPETSQPKRWRVPPFSLGGLRLRNALDKSFSILGQLRIIPRSKPATHFRLASHCFAQDGALLTWPFWLKPFWLKTFLLSRIRLFVFVLPVARFISFSHQVLSAVLMVRKGFRLHQELAREILEALFSSPRKAPQQQGRGQ